MEYLRKEDVEKEEETETAACRIGTIVDADSSGIVETSTQDAEFGQHPIEISTQDVEVNQVVEVWPDQERKVCWVDRIKIIGENAIVFTFYHHTIGW